MENREAYTEHEQLWKKTEQAHRRGKIFGGFLIVLAGSLFLAKELGADIPQWIFSWKMFLIALGLMIAVKNKFMHPAWLVLVVIGGTFLFADMYPGISIKPFLWPVLIILFGLFIIFKPKRQKRENAWSKFHDREAHYKRGSYADECFGEVSSTTEDFLDYTTFMGAVKKNVLTKNFKGGDVTIIFGGAEINLLQADFENTATLDLTCVFAGAKLIIPSNWEINSELVSAFGSVEDKRPVQPKVIDGNTKTLILKGTVFFGGIDIKSY